MDPPVPIKAAIRTCPYGWVTGSSITKGEGRQHLHITTLVTLPQCASQSQNGFFPSSSCPQRDTSDEGEEN